MSLANKYRPKKFDDVVEQDMICNILQTQISEATYSHALLFKGNAGCGKTTVAKILATAINGEILELDCASHNGVAEIKEIIENAKIPSLIYEYKVFILDECHMLTSQAWSSLLITLEENIPHAVFIFCTTNTEKIPNTIISRVMEFVFKPISDKSMKSRLNIICKNESIIVNDDALDCIVRSAKGNLRQALTNIDKCLLYADLSVENICAVLNIVSYDIFDELYDAFVNDNNLAVIELVDRIYNAGFELHSVITQFLEYSLTKTNMDLVSRLLTITQDIKYDDSPKNIIIARLIV